MSGIPISANLEAAAAPARAVRARGRPTFRQLTLGLAALGLLWRVFTYALGMPIWGDESFVAINFVMRDFAQLFDPLIYGQICPLLYMWAVEAVSQVGGYSEWSLRLVAFVAGMAALFLFAKWTRALLPRSAWFCAVALFAASYFIMRHSNEVKPYATDLLVSLGLMTLGWRVFTQPRSIPAWCALILLAAIGPWASYPSMFIGGAVGLLLTWGLLRSRFEERYLIGWAALGVALCGSAFLMYRFYAKPHAGGSAKIFELDSWSSTFPPVAEPWKLPMWFYTMHTGNMFAYPQGGQAPGSIGTFLLFIVGCIRLWKKNRPLLLLLVAPFALTFVAAAMKAYPYGGSARVSQYLAPIICIGAGLGLSVVLRRFLWGVHLRRSFWIAAILFALIPLSAMARSIIKPYKDEKALHRYESVQWVIEKTRPGDQWVIFNAIDKGVPHAPWMGDWAGVGAEFLFNVMRHAPVPVSWSPPPASVNFPADVAADTSTTGTRILSRTDPPQETTDTTDIAAGTRSPSRIQAPRGRVILIVYYAHRPGKVDFPEDLRDVYVAEIAGRLGEPARDDYVIRQDAGGYESMQTFIFAPTTSP